MGVVRLFMSMSLDGFISDREGDSSSLYRKQVIGGADTAQQDVRTRVLRD